ncbi:MAG TPA: hypothetical protein VFM60_04610 [Salinimicrobium sp.]|nr:hypothetical protein [Salinimicrobium sp.]
MVDLTQIIDSLENRIRELLGKHQDLRRENRSLNQELSRLREENRQLQKGLETSENNIQTVKAANALLGSNDYKKETKLKINGLIREIDHCIVQLSE